MSGYYGYTTPTDAEELWDEVRRLRSRVTVLEQRLGAVADTTEEVQP